jgi:hypothetical protein
MSENPRVTMQINLAPSDLPHARYTLPHQLRQWAAQVDEIVLVLDLHQSKGRYSEGWAERLPGMRALLEDCCRPYEHARTVDVDYAPEVAERLAARFFGGRHIPAKDWQGGPFYSYFFGLDAATHPYVLHMDADMMYGGGSQTWIAEAIDLLIDRPDVAVCNPLPGPPTATGELRSQTLVPEPMTSSLAYSADQVSTRILFTDMRRLCDRMTPIPFTSPPLRKWLMAVVDGNPANWSGEHLLSEAMVAHGLTRIDFLGRGSGMWSLHPPYRSPTFYQRLPALIEEVETGRVPEAQRGHHDVHDSMVDWTSARRLIEPVWRRALKHQRLLVRNVADRLRGGRGGSHAPVRASRT